MWIYSAVVNVSFKTTYNNIDSKSVISLWVFVSGLYCHRLDQEEYIINKCVLVWNTLANLALLLCLPLKIIYSLPWCMNFSVMKTIIQTIQSIHPSRGNWRTYSGVVQSHKVGVNIWHPKYLIYDPTYDNKFCLLLGWIQVSRESNHYVLYM